MGSIDADDFDEFAVAAWPRLRWAAYLLCHDSHLAEDLAQATLVRTYASWHRVRRRDAYAYARKVLVNLNVDRLRRRRPEVGLPTADPGDHAVTAADRDEVVRLLRPLTERERRVVVLRHYFDLSEAETATELGIARGTVKSTLSRALTKLRAHHPTTAETTQRGQS
ncbi:MAG: SigE family RNA polymerase sigma factor [Nocardioides sp.]|uniref:SigE family RNA polymerase sigma factor n=1 Tax=Nocardioides sp. TaxID=35761 RepID=UPI0039E44164